MKSVKDISIKKFLAERGVIPKLERGGYGMYCSPLRSESTPSFKVDYNKNLWHDFGSGDGGSIIDLVMKLENCNVADAYRKLESCYDTLAILAPQPIRRTLPSPLQITNVSPLSHPRLIAYITQERAIDLEVAKRYCREVHYTIGDKRLFAVGFQSDGGGWEFSATGGFKLSTSPKLPTTINVGVDSTLLFEGFIDMLSYLSLKKLLTPAINICVLNSVNNLHKAEEFLKTQSKVYCFLDNDEAGHKALNRVQSICKETIDYSKIYANFNDVNDFLKSRNQAQKPPQRGVKMKF